MRKIKVSIVIPVYNIPEELLVSSLDSVVKEKSRDIEILIIDDGSCDDVAKVCDIYADESNDIFVYHQVNQGVSVARNRGIEEANGDYIAFVDSDDVINMKGLLVSSDYASERNLDICFFKYRRDTNFGSFSSKTVVADDMTLTEDELIYNIAIQNEPFAGYCVGSPWGKVFKREFLISNNLRFLKSLRKMQDRVFMMYCLKHSPQIALLPVEGYCYVVNSESIVNKYNPKIGEYIANVYKEIRNFNLQYNVFKDIDMHTIGVILVLEYLGLDTLHKNNNNSTAKKVFALRKYLSDNGFDRCIRKYDKAVLQRYDRNSNIKMLLLRCKLPRLLIYISKMYSRKG